jgi:decaprenyl-phosphate phosphoribosyltransferase
MRTEVRSGELRGLLTTARPRQWSKNALVLVAPLAGGVLLESTVIASVVAAFVAFVMASASIYLVNDTLDREADRLHPVKRHRPVAAGQVRPQVALATAAVLGLGSVVLATAVDLDLLATVAVYLVLQLAYALWLKHVAVLDIAIVSSGFLLRAIAGGVAADVPLSQWFLLVAAFGSLFMVAGKRYSELMTLGAAGGTRRSLNDYSDSYLRFVWSLAAAVAVTAYSLWAFELVPTGHVNWQAISIAPFVVGILRYAVDVDRGLAGEPEDAVARDRVLQLVGLVWVVLFALGVYA